MRRTDAVPAGQAGFTLVEVLVAFLVLALAMIVIQRAVMTGVAGAARAGQRLEAERVARTLMTAPLGTGAQGPAPATGTTDGHAWALRFEPVDLPFPQTVTADGRAPAFQVLRMIVTVAPRAGRGPDMRLETLRLVEMAAP